MKFDVVATNPPFQDSTNQKKTQHKLWIKFTQSSFDNWLKPGGILLQVSPSSFLSPSNKVLDIFRKKIVKYLNLDSAKYFPSVGSTFADYLIVNSKSKAEVTTIKTDKVTFDKCIDGSVFYFPNDLCEESYSIHKKVIFDYPNKLDVKYDYVNCHNVLIHRNDTISKTKTDIHIYPIFHTNKQTWYSKIRQSWANENKIMWSRSGYTKIFYDDGVLGGTDMVYYVLVSDKEEGENLTHNLSSKLIQYILRTAKWSGFGNEKVFKRLPNLPKNVKLTDDQIYDLFNLSNNERQYVEQNIK
jgi:hypothetical protein